MRGGMSRVVLQWMWLCIAVGGACAHAADQRTRIVDLRLVAKVTISPEGRITDLAWRLKKPGEQAIADAIEPHVRALEFEPALADGQPVVAETHLSVQLHLGQAQAGGWEAAILSASTGAIMERMGPPQYPAQALKQGVEAEVVSEVAYDEDGRPSVVDATVESSAGGGAHRAAFVKAARNAILDWRFIPERAGGKALPGRMQVPLSFYLPAGGWCDARTPGPARERRADHSVVRLKTTLGPGEG